MSRLKLYKVVGTQQTTTSDASENLMDIEDAIQKIQALIATVDKLLSYQVKSEQFNKAKLKEHRATLVSLLNSAEATMSFSTSKVRYLTSIQRFVKAQKALAADANTAAKKTKQPRNK